MTVIYGDQDPENLNDTLNGTEGDDTIYAGDGNDTIFTNTGNDTVDAGKGDDTVYAAMGNNIIDGGEGNDTITSSGGDDTIHGGDGNDTISGGGGNDTIYGDAGNDTIHTGDIYAYDTTVIASTSTVYGGDGSDTITGGSGAYYEYDESSIGHLVYSPDQILVVNGGRGNDTITSQCVTHFTFDADFGQDTISVNMPAPDPELPDDGSLHSKITFSFDRPEGLRLMRNEKDLYIETQEGVLRVQGYFDRPTLYDISFSNGTDTISTATVLSAIVNGGDNDELLGARFEETNTDIVIHGGAGDDRLESSDISGTAGNGRTTYMDGGAGDDVYVTGSENVTLAFSRDTGRDLFIGKGVDGDGPGAQHITIELADTTSGTLATTDLSLAYENGNFVLHAGDSDAALVITAPQALRIMKNIDTWSAQDGSGSLDIRTLLEPLWTAQFGNSAFAVGNADYIVQSTDESVFASTGTVTSGSGNQTIYGGATVVLNNGFGEDIISTSGNIIFMDDTASYSFSRDGRSLIVENGLGDKATLYNFLPGGGFSSSFSGNTRIIIGDPNDGGTALTWADLETQLSASSTATEITLVDGDNYFTGMPVEASNQLIHANLGTITVNGGSGNNIIDNGQHTTIIHDTSLGGHDDLYSYGGIDGPGFAALHIQTADINNLSAHLENSKLTITDTVTGSSVVLMSTLIDHVYVGSTQLDKAWMLSHLDNGTTGLLYSTVQNKDGALRLESAGDNTDDTLMTSVGGSSSGINYSQWLIQDGHGGSDTYYGSMGSDIFIYSGGGNDVIEGLEKNSAATIGYDIVDFRQAGVASSSLTTAFSRDGNNLVYTDGSDSLTVKDFFVHASLEEAHENFFGQYINPQGPMANFNGNYRDIQNVIGLLVGFASDFSPFSVSHVVDSLHFTDRVVSYAEIAALFPDHAVPTPHDDVLYTDQIGNTIDALAGNDIVYGNSSSNTLIGNDGDDTLYGYGGDDTLEGDGVNNTLVGGDGNDTYIVSSSGDTVVEDSDGGYDIVQSSVSFTLGDNVEDLALQGSGNINGTGNALDNFITGNDGNNVINGGAGNDIMIGGLGDDTYYVDSPDDLIIENDGEGNDTVYVAAGAGSDYYVPEGIENVILLGSSNMNAYGSSVANTITGNSGNNTLSGGNGVDTLAGGAGNDTYVIAVGGDSTDVIIENAGEGTDTVQSAITWTLGANLENLTLTGTLGTSGTGNGLNNVITGNSGNNTLTGGAGNDTLAGGAGNDTYVIAASGDDSDVITELAGEGTDLVQSAATWTLSANVENLTLTGSGNINGTGNSGDNVITGNSGNNTLTGGAGNDTLDGGLGTDTLIGGTGDDLYILSSTGDTITENSGEGTDTVQANYSYTLGANLENLTLVGTGNINGTGNAQDNVIIGESGNNTLTGNAGNDILKGGAGTDQLLGGVGNDTYVLNRGDGADAITENDSAAGNTDVARFGETGTAINHDQLWFKMNGSNLEISVIGTSDKFTINSWSAGSARQVESFVASDGYHMTNAQVANLVSAMASFSPPSAGTTTLDPGTYSSVLSQIAVAWSA
jgi:Ca2+-binding RTX toxin-like protein